MIKDVFLQKGWAGKTISREETVERLNPLLRLHHALNQAYYAVMRTTDDDALEADLASLVKVARMDTGKLAETVFSAGGTAYNGTDLEADQFDLGNTRAAMLTALREREQALYDAVAAESAIEHQMRTRAILGVVQTNSQNRLTYLKQANKQTR